MCVCVCVCIIHVYTVREELRHNDFSVYPCACTFVCEIVSSSSSSSSRAYIFILTRPLRSTNKTTCTNTLYACVFYTRTHTHTYAHARARVRYNRLLPDGCYASALSADADSKNCLIANTLSRRSHATFGLPSNTTRTPWRLKISYLSYTDVTRTRANTNFPDVFLITIYLFVTCVEIMKTHFHANVPIRNVSRCVKPSNGLCNKNVRIPIPVETHRDNLRLFTIRAPPAHRQLCFVDSGSVFKTFAEKYAVRCEFSRPTRPSAKVVSSSHVTRWSFQLLETRRATKLWRQTISGRTYSLLQTKYVYL